MKITVADFFTGFFSALALSTEDQKRTFECGENFNEALHSAYGKFCEAAHKVGLRPNFQIHLNPLHGDSRLIEEGIGGAIRRDLISLDNPNFEKVRLIIPLAEARENVESAPGGAQLYEDLAAEFLKQFDSSLVTS